jgi:antitoxin ParD1/3/4
MDVELTPELEQLVKSKVESGRYHSASEVVRQALRLFEHLDESVPLSNDEILEQIEEGWQGATCRIV